MSRIKCKFVSLMFSGVLVGLCAPFAHAQPYLEKPPQLFIVDVPAPPLAGVPGDWLNTGGSAVPFQPGRVYVVHFWAFGCINCKRNLPAYSAWHARYGNHGATVIGVHTPETEKEKDPKNVAQEVQRWGITYPVLIDGSSLNWKRWQQQVWPTVYLVDKRGRVRFYWVGELEWEKAGGTQIMEQYIQMLLRENVDNP